MRARWNMKERRKEERTGGRKNESGNEGIEKRKNERKGDRSELKNKEIKLTKKKEGKKKGKYERRK